MHRYVAPESNSEGSRNKPVSSTVAERRINFEAMPSARGGFVREDERPRTESYGELYQRASIYRRR